MDFPSCWVNQITFRVCNFPPFLLLRPTSSRLGRGSPLSGVDERIGALCQCLHENSPLFSDRKSLEVYLIMVSFRSVAEVMKISFSPSLDEEASFFYQISKR